MRRKVEMGRNAAVAMLLSGPVDTAAGSMHVWHPCYTPLPLRPRSSAVRAQLERVPRFDAETDAVLEIEWVFGPVLRMSASSVHE